MTPTSIIPTVKLLIDGKFVESHSAEWRNIVNPATQQVLARVPFATPADAEGDIFRGLEVVEHAANIGSLQVGELANNVAGGVNTTISLWSNP